VFAGIFFFIVFQLFVIFFLWEHHHYHNNKFEWETYLLIEIVPALTFTILVSVSRYATYDMKLTEEKEKRCRSIKRR
jgi:hypothetical protein